MSATPIKHAGSEGGESEDNLAPSSTSKSSAAAALSTALSPSLEGLILFDLTTAPGASVAFSPHCMKSIVDLKILDVGYERHRLSFVQVRSDLEARVQQPGVTVPTLEVADGTSLTDSWAIAEWLAANHPQGQRLFPSTASKRLASFLSEVGKTYLSPNLGPLCLPGVASRLDEDSKKYFIERKIGQERFNKMISITSDEKQGYIEGAHKVLGAVEVAMGYSTEPPPPAAPAVPSPWLDAGPTPTHADAIMYGFIVFSRMAGKETWCKLWQPFPRLVRLAAAMEDFLGEEITRDYVKLV